MKCSSFVVSGLACLGTSAFAANGFYVCNESTEVISAAIGQFENNLWASHGWTTVETNACAQLSPALTATRYFVYAISASGKTWGGSHPFCAANNVNFNFPNGVDFGNCPTQLSFFSVWVPDMVTGAYPTHHAVVVGPNNNNLDDPRAER